MKLSPRTMQILKNFASINQSIMFKSGDVLSTISPGKTVLAKAKVAETFERQFAIFDLARFIGVMSLFNEPVIETHEKFCEIKDNNQKVHYTYTDPSMIVTPPDKEVKIDQPDIEFTLTADTFSRIMRAVAVLQTAELAVVGNGTTISLQTFDSKNSTSDTFSIAVGETTHTFEMIFKVDNLKLLSGDYEVKMTRKKFGHFKGNDVEYWITTESNSTFSE